MLPGVEKREKLPTFFRRNSGRKYSSGSRHSLCSHSNPFLKPFSLSSKTLILLPSISPDFTKITAFQRAEIWIGRFDFVQSLNAERFNCPSVSIVSPWPQQIRVWV
uniref:Uncharacterized protein n=1 Tax=Opuntia streptacantha TaxID=393608 RepID=A0A7C9AR70_OPUST